MSARGRRLGGLAEAPLLDAAGIASALRALGGRIRERNPDPRGLLLCGIRTGGVFLSRRLQRLISDALGAEVSLGAMDISLYRDDVFVGLPRPEVGPTELPGALDGRTVVLVDDVLFTGRTVRAALAELVDFGRPSRVELAVLVDRGGRELPIQADYVGLRVAARPDQSVRVLLREAGEADRVVLLEKRPASS